MEKGNNKETEDYLGAFKLKTVPPGLKEKILDGALRKRDSGQGMTTLVRKGLMGCLILSFIAIAVDVTITQAQNKRFSSLLGIQQESADWGMEEWSMLEEILGGPMNAAESAVKMKYYGTQEKAQKRGRLPEWRESIIEELE